MLIAGIMVIGLTLYIYKPTYTVTLNGEFLGYTRDKSSLQARINDYIQQGNGDIAFVQVSDMPEYNLCMVKKDIQTNDDEIYNYIVNQGTKYYRYYALLQDGEEKYYFQNFNEAEDVVNKLKDKNSENADSLTVLEKYNTNNVEYANIDDCVSNLYQEKVVEVKKVVTTAKSTGSGIGASGMNTSSSVVNIGISLIKPVSGMLTSRYGPRSRDNHKGIDIGASYASPIYAAASGTVTTAEYGSNGGYGNYVIISHGNGVQTLYGHCSSLCISSGESVSQGQLIAKVGSTGNSTGNHLHFEVRVNGVTQDPQNYVY